MASDPSTVCCAPINVIWLCVKDILGGEGCADHVASGRVLHTLGLACGTTGVQLHAHAYIRTDCIPFAMYRLSGTQAAWQWVRLRRNKTQLFFRDQARQLVMDSYLTCTCCCKTYELCTLCSSHADGRKPSAHSSVRRQMWPEDH